MSRRLAIIPIVHTEADLGELGRRLREHTGIAEWRAKQEAVDSLWASIRAWCDSIDARGLHLFQDSLPRTAGAEAIVNDLASKGSTNHGLLKTLIDRGAHLHGTEEPSLLLREYEMAQTTAEAAAAGREPDPRHTQRAASLLARRDQAIAERIDTTLTPGSRGLLFIGMLHDVACHLPESLEIEYPVGRPSDTRQAG